MANSIKVPPHSDEAEASVLGAILIDPDAIISVAEFLRPEHFYSETNSMIFKAILDLYEERSPIDIVTLTDKLKKNRVLLKVGGSSYLAELLDKVPTAANCEKYGEIVKNLCVKRQLISAAAKIADVSFDEGTEANEALDQAEMA
ncbi:MAG: DnaB-like helicase N-terminal domain-containing protein, partial [Microgenomates group bacterium]